MSADSLNRFLSAAKDFDASDLHLVVGVPPAFRVNGEIIIADEDALSEEQLTTMANSLLNEQQQRKFEQDWELCISLLHSVAGRVRATFYRRNGHPELSLRFCGERIATRAELGLPERLDELARKACALVSARAGVVIDPQSAIFGEISLSGALRPVAQTENRLKEAQKLGFTTAILPERAKRTGGAGLILREFADLAQAVTTIIGPEARGPTNGTEG